MHDMVQDHDKDVKKFRQEAEHANDPDLKAFAQKTLPVLEQHQKLAHDISKSLTAVGSSGQAQGTRTADQSLSPRRSQRTHKGHDGLILRFVAFVNPSCPLW